MNNTLTLFSILLVSVFSFSASAQKSNNDWCGTDEKWAEAVAKNPALEQKMQQMIQTAKKTVTAQKTVYTIPVVAHVFRDPETCSGNISKAQIEDGIRVLNEDFRRTNPDSSNTRSVFKPYAADVEVQFKLAKLDPNGNCTEGIVRVASELTNDADNSIKYQSYWPNDEYLNIWLVNNIATSGGGTILGYAELPYNGIGTTWGLVVRHDQWGTIGTSNADGRTATHEVGHCLGLLHTFQSGCGGSCGNSGDYVCDTPPSANATYFCSTSQNTCGMASGSTPYTTDVVDQIENYMSYDDCQNMFSLGQKSIIQGNIQNISGLQNLTSSSNLMATGTNAGYTPQTCTPISEFNMCTPEFICTGDSIYYEDESYNGTPTSWSWSFAGGTPGSSTDSSEYVTYNSGGIYDVSLTATNSAGSDTHTKQNIAYVTSTSAKYSSATFYDNFENAGNFANDYIVLNPTGTRKWEHDNSAGYSGSSSVSIFNFSNALGAVDELITPTFDLTQVNSPDLMFRVAYRQKSSSTNDGLRVYVSSNCGKSWALKFVTLGGSGLETGSPTTSPYTPSSGSDWKLHTIDLGSYANKSNVMFKFQFIADGGNNIFLDDINIKNYTGIEEHNSVVSDMKVFPNPSTGNAKVSFELKENATADLAIYNVMGEKVLSFFDNRSIKSGEHNVDFSNGKQLSKGIYFVKLRIDQDEVITKKLVIQ